MVYTLASLVVTIVTQVSEVSPAIRERTKLEANTLLSTLAVTIALLRSVAR